jgi:hypothetical protein
LSFLVPFILADGINVWLVVLARVLEASKEATQRGLPTDVRLEDDLVADPPAIALEVELSSIGWSEVLQRNAVSTGSAGA